LRAREGKGGSQDQLCEKKKKKRGEPEEKTIKGGGRTKGKGGPSQEKPKVAGG